jgi:hypothetical protein
MLKVKTKDITTRIYPGLTAEAVRDREVALERFASWEADHPALLAPDAALAAVAALYDLLPVATRRRAPDPSGVMAYHALFVHRGPAPHEHP